MKKICRDSRWLTSLAIWIGLALRVAAQPAPVGQPLDLVEPKAYVRFKIAPDYEKFLKDRLEMENELAPLKDLIRQVLADPKAFNVAPTKIKEMKLEDAKFKRAVLDWLKSDPQLRDSVLEWIQKNEPTRSPTDVKKLQSDLKGILDEGGGNLPAPPSSSPTVEPVRVQEDPLNKLAVKAMEQTNRTQLGEWLSNSPAWDRAFKDLRDSFNARDTSRGNLSDWQRKLLAPEGDTLRFAENTLERLADLQPPQFKRLGRGFSLPGLGNVALPELGAPGAGDLNTPSFTFIGTAAGWGILILICVLVIGRLWRGRKSGSASREKRPDLGPWPIRPEAVATRAELVRAFDYLALWTLGAEAQSWNHRAVTNRWREQAPACADAASALADLYEEARYTDAVQDLSEAQRELARQALVQIAEAL